MLCKNCNAQIEENAEFCNNCGASVTETVEQPIVANNTAIPNVSSEITAANLPEHLRPLSPWAYFGLQLLYSIPIVGFIFLIIFSFKKSNINRRNFTRSYWCALIIWGAVAISVFILALIFGIGGVMSSRTGF